MTDEQQSVITGGRTMETKGDDQAAVAEGQRNVEEGDDTDGSGDIR